MCMQDARGNFVYDALFLTSYNAHDKIAKLLLKDMSVSFRYRTRRSNRVGLLKASTITVMDGLL